MLRGLLTGQKGCCKARLRIGVLEHALTAFARSNSFAVWFSSRFADLPPFSWSNFSARAR